MIRKLVMALALGSAFALSMANVYAEGDEGEKKSDQQVIQADGDEGEKKSDQQ